MINDSCSLYPWKVQGGYNPIKVVKSEGVFFWDDNGKRYYDMTSQLVNVNIGHHNRKIIRAIKEQADRICYISPAYDVDGRQELANKIISLAPANMGKVLFTLGGAESNEHALRIARAFTGRYKVMSRYRSYHGATFGAANLSGESRRFAAEPGLSGFVKFFDPYIYRDNMGFKSEEEATAWYLSRLEQQIIFEGADQIAAIFMESVTGSNGIIIPPAGYMQGVRKLCTKYGILMVCDEVMTGWLRTGKWFACQNWDVEPDIITFSKGITCGYVPLGGVIVSREIASYFDSHQLVSGLTCSGYPMGCAVGLAVISEYERLNIPAKVAFTGKVLARELKKLYKKHSCIGDIRCIGLFAGIELVRDRATREPVSDEYMTDLISRLMNEGFSTYTHGNVLIIAPPLIITSAQIREAMSIMNRVLD
ncbi:MAG: aminotransferase class III-fold pyridoxal phosphate-dependent enzyme [Spirochaetia bacterium]|nr:aminotransferase class III-fold pyridoxal phosphate-dependent enzyme [Spirochaetia bacterium]